MPRGKAVLALPPVDADDLEKIRSIGAEFIASLPSIRALCERVLLESTADREVVCHLLSGMAACDDLLDLAGLLANGADGTLRCSSCGRCYEYLLFGDRVAVYTDESRALRDYKERAPLRAEGFVVPPRDDDVVDPRVAALLSLARRKAHPEAIALLRSFLGSLRCNKCGVQGPPRAT